MRDEGLRDDRNGRQLTADNYDPGNAGIPRAPGTAASLIIDQLGEYTCYYAAFNFLFLYRFWAYLTGHFSLTYCIKMYRKLTTRAFHNWALSITENFGKATLPSNSNFVERLGRVDYI